MRRFALGLILGILLGHATYALAATRVIASGYLVGHFPAPLYR